MKMPGPFTEKKKVINVIIETPRGSSAKYAFDPETELFKLNKILPAGMVFPFEFGFIPHTMAEDGDPMDVLVLMEKSAYPGCLVECLVLGVIEAEQEKEWKMIRNDRIVARAVDSRLYSSLDSIKDIDKKIIDDIILFFVTYHKRNGDQFTVLKSAGRSEAIKLIQKNSNNGDA